MSRASSARTRTADGDHDRARPSRHLACGALALVLCAAQAWAEEPATVLVLYAEDLALAQRVEAELGAAGFTAVARAASEPLEGVLAQAAQRADAAAALALSARSGQVWLYLRVRDETSAHTPPEGAEASDESVAIFATELVRANLLALPEPPPVPVARDADADEAESAPSPAAVPGARSLTAPPAPPTSRPEARSGRTDARRTLLAAELGPAVLFSRGGLAPQATLSFALMARVARALRAGLLSLIPLHSSELSTAEGTSQTRFSWLGVELRGELPAASALRASLAGGAGVVILASHSTETAPELLDNQLRRVSAGAYLGSGAIYALTPALALRLEARVGALLNPFRIEYGGRPVARWGLPWLAATLSLEWYFF